MAIAEQKMYTLEDIYNLPDGQRAELIDGAIYFITPPSRRHQEILFSLSRKIADYIDSQKGTCKIYLAPFAVFLNEDQKNYVEPDISIICDKNKLSDKGCAGAPDWIIEIVSPSSQRMDYMIKLFKYRTAGVREYWIVDPAKNRITTYDFVTDSIEEYTMADFVTCNIYEGLEIDFSEI